MPTYIYHLGDFDPSGVNAGEKIEETLRELAPDADIYFERIAVTPGADRRMGPADAADQNRPTPAPKGFGDIRVELDAIEPNRLRRIVQEAIEVLKATEESERNIISRLVRTATRPRKGAP